MSDPNVHTSDHEPWSEAVEGLADRVGAHFADDCEPPIPALMVGTALRAIGCVVSGEPATVLDLPAEVFYMGKPTVEAQVVVDTLYLQHFVDEIRVQSGAGSAGVETG